MADNDLPPRGPQPDFGVQNGFHSGSLPTMGAEINVPAVRLDNQILAAIQGLQNSVQGLQSSVQGLQNSVQGIENRMQRIENHLQGLQGKISAVQCIFIML
jgi:hypothetical protein